MSLGRELFIGIVAALAAHYLYDLAQAQERDSRPVGLGVAGTMNAYNFNPAGPSQDQMVKYYKTFDSAARDAYYRGDDREAWKQLHLAQRALSLTNSPDAWKMESQYEDTIAVLAAGGML